MAWACMYGSNRLPRIDAAITSPVMANAAATASPISQRFVRTVILYQNTRFRLRRRGYHKLMATTTKTLYDTDFVEWTAHTAELLREGRLDAVDLEHLAEEIEDLGKSDRHTVLSHLHRLLLHQIKRK